jgi:hypothetical protein
VRLTAACPIIAQEIAAITDRDAEGPLAGHFLGGTGHLGERLRVTKTPARATRRRVSENTLSAESHVKHQDGRGVMRQYATVVTPARSSTPIGNQLSQRPFIVRSCVHMADSLQLTPNIDAQLCLIARWRSTMLLRYRHRY